MSGKDYDLKITFSESPFVSYIRALWQLENYNEIIDLITVDREIDPVLNYFRIQSLLKVTT